jgi:hypothetical protein
MSECHKCEWNEKQASLAKREACLSCRLSTTPYNSGRIFVSLDAGNGQTKAEVEASTMDHTRSSLDGILNDCCQETAKRVLEYLGNLPAIQREILFDLMRGLTLVQIAKTTKLTRQDVSWHWRKLKASHPELAKFVPRKSTKSTK